MVSRSRHRGHASAGAGFATPSDRAPGRIVVQTRVPGHEVFRAAALADPGRLTTAEAEVRRSLAFPPFGTFVGISGEAAEEYVAALRVAIREGSRTGMAGVALAGPVEGKWSLRSQDRGELLDLLARTPRPSGRLRVEVDSVR